MSSIPGGPTQKGGERQPPNTTTDDSSEAGKGSHAGLGNACPPTSANINAMLSVARNASSTMPSTARTNLPAELTNATPPAQAIEYRREPPNAHERNAPTNDLTTILQILVEKVDDFTRAKTGTDNPDPESAQGHDEEVGNLWNARCISTGRAAQIQRNLFGNSETPIQR